MNIEQMKKVIQDNTVGFRKKIREIKEVERYYQNKNDVLRVGATEKKSKFDDDSPLRNADNRISHPWHQLLLNQKTAYTMTVPPMLDVDDEKVNDEIVKLLGDKYPKIAKQLCVNAGNAGIAWLHIWRDTENNFFRYGVVDSKQIFPIFSKSLDQELIGLLRIYESYDENGETLEIYEYWDSQVCEMFSRPKSQPKETLFKYPAFEMIDISLNEPTGERTNVFEHGWGAVPFIPFRNNPDESNDLVPIKGLVDAYDKVFSGFVNDIDDIQEIIFVLTNYGGQDKKEFLSDLKQFKMVKVEDHGEGSEGKVDTLAVDIPLDAREKLLELTRESIFTHGQGVDPQKNIGQNNSGAALKYMYSLLELKASLLETEFRIGFAQLARFILKYFKLDPDIQIKQTWTRTAISNELEKADVIAKLASITSQENIAKSNPLVTDWQAELANLKKEKEDNYRATDDYRPEEIDLSTNEDEEEND